MFMLPIVCFPFLTPVMRVLANLFPDAGMRQVMPCCWQAAHGPGTFCLTETNRFCQKVSISCISFADVHVFRNKAMRGTWETCQLRWWKRLFQ